mmetsp:Transcript_18236/g.32664  ORF Transcript_18236/g.32664 Transcript_18236/m.32664 type:complete len:223 (+) Transcript_18236:967-1635(+)
MAGGASDGLSAATLGCVEAGLESPLESSSGHGRDLKLGIDWTCGSSMSLARSGSSSVSIVSPNSSFASTVGIAPNTSAAVESLRYLRLFSLPPFLSKLACCLALTLMFPGEFWSCSFSLTGWTVMVILGGSDLVNLDRQLTNRFIAGRLLALLCRRVIIETAWTSYWLRKTSAGMSGTRSDSIEMGKSLRMLTFFSFELLLMKLLLIQLPILPLLMPCRTWP